MGRNARLRKMRREMLHQAARDPGVAELVHRGMAKKNLLVAQRGREKMSVVIQELAEPMLEDAEDFEAVRKSLVFAIVVWNYSLIPEQDRKTDGLVAELLSDPVIEKAFRLMLERKEKLFPDNKRQILDYDIRQKGSEVSFNVTSELQ